MRRLSVNEELRLAEIPADALESEEASGEDAQRAVHAMMTALASLLQARALNEQLVIDETWVGENLTSADLEGIVAYLRGDIE
ncbi:hypothetical protein [Deinococcus maricopensis]|nr:hypothetical protein [Deinococcus maricopensis]